MVRQKKLRTVWSSSTARLIQFGKSTSDFDLAYKISCTLISEIGRNIQRSGSPKAEDKLFYTDILN